MTDLEFGWDAVGIATSKVANLPAPDSLNRSARGKHLQFKLSSLPADWVNVTRPGTAMLVERMNDTILWAGVITRRIRSTSPLLTIECSTIFDSLSDASR